MSLSGERRQRDEISDEEAQAVKRHKNNDHHLKVVASIKSYNERQLAWMMREIAINPDMEPVYREAIRKAGNAVQRMINDDLELRLEQM